MGLREAVLEIADALEEDTEALLSDNRTKIILINHARSIRLAVLASEGTAQAGQPVLSPDMQHLRMVEQAREEFRAAKRKGELQEQGEIVGIPCADGPLEGDSVPCDPGMPVGARCNLDGNTYRLGEDRKLHYEEPKTEPPGLILPG